MPSSPLPRGDIRFISKCTPRWPVPNMPQALFTNTSLAMARLKWSFSKRVDKKKKPYALLASQTIPGANLHHILKHEPQKLDQLDLHRLHNLLLTAILINPEDGQPANFIFKPIQTKLGETKYELIGIDNDHAFVPPFSTVKNFDSHPIPNKSRSNRFSFALIRCKPQSIPKPAPTF